MRGASLLGSIPWHLGVGGFLVFLAATLFALRADYSGETLFRPFYIVYNVGVVLTAGSLLAKGLSLLTGTATPLAYTVYEAVGVVGGVLMVAGLVLLMMLLRRSSGTWPRRRRKREATRRAAFPRQALGAYSPTDFM